MTDTITPEQLREQITRLLKALPDEGEHWHVEALRPGHEDEARVYGRGSWGVAKPTTRNPAARRPTAEFIAAAPDLLRALAAQLEAAERDKAHLQEDLAHWRERARLAENARTDLLVERIAAEREGDLR